MKILSPLAVGLAGALAASSLRAQEPTPTPTPTDARTRSEQIVGNPLVQQFLRVIVQKALEGQPQGGTGGDTTGSGLAEAASKLLSSFTDSSGDSPSSGVLSSGAAAGGEGQTPLVARRSGLDAYSDARFASEPGERRLDPATRTWVTRPWNAGERARMQARFQQDYARLSAADRATWETPVGTEAALAHAWDSSLGSAHLQAGGGLQTGGLRTGTLQTGTLSTSHLTSGMTSTVLPPQEFIPPPAPVAAVHTPAVADAVSAPPVDPDDQMRRWSQKIDAQFATEQEARGAAVRAYPDLGVADSAFNTQFRARYAQYRQADPFGFLRGPGWPMKLAIFTDGDLKRQSSGSAAAP